MTTERNNYGTNTSTDTHVIREAVRPLLVEHTAAVNAAQSKKIRPNVVPIFNLVWLAVGVMGFIDLTGTADLPNLVIFAPVIVQAILAVIMFAVAGVFALIVLLLSGSGGKKR